MDFARHEFKLSRPGEDGVSLREKLESVGAKALQNAAEMPRALEHVWKWFVELSQARPSGMGISPITFSEISAWVSLTGNQPTPWEVSLIRGLDIAYLKEMAANG